MGLFSMNVVYLNSIVLPNLSGLLCSGNRRQLPTSNRLVCAHILAAGSLKTSAAPGYGPDCGGR
jgi:hypothetical protein